MRVKTNMITVKVRPDIHAEYKLASDLKGGTMSGLIHQFIVRTIQEQKERHPKAFERLYERPVITARTAQQKGKIRRARSS